MGCPSNMELFRINHCAWFAKAILELGISGGPAWPDKFGDALLAFRRRRSGRKIRTLSLFSGGGGLDIGFHDAGFDIVECNELVPEFAATLERNSKTGGRLEGTKVVCKDINDYHPELNDIDFIIGGPPCQTFSAAGARAAGVNGIDDERGSLFLQYARLIYKLQPQGFLFENVYRIIGAQGGEPWRQIQTAFEDLGYKLHWMILDSADYGVPQFRERLIIVGLKSGNFEFPYPSHGPDSADKRDYYSAQEAISGVKNLVIPNKIGGRHGHLLDQIPPGLNYSFFTERMGHPTPFFAWRSKFSDYLYKADPEQPVRTIKAQGGQYTGPFSWLNRPFSVEELKRLQTFPDDYELNGKRQRAIHQLGNSVPPQFARILALSIRKQVFFEEIPFEIDYLPKGLQLGFRTRKSALTSIYEQKAKKAIAEIVSVPVDMTNDASGEYFFDISSDLKVAFKDEDEHARFFSSYQLSNRRLSIVLAERGDRESTECYRIKIRSISEAASKSCSEIILSSSIDREGSLLAIWKSLELVLKRIFHKDDLIQFFGYYQYKNNFRMEMTFSEEIKGSRSFWDVAQKITQGIGVGEIRSISDLSTEFDCDAVGFGEALSRLKVLGFEIRNQNTNKQIKPGMILIPYSFPTLNERSLQRLTSL